MECACGGAALQTGEFVSNMSNGIDTFSIREPLGVCAGICPFTFPAMIPLWVSLTTAASMSYPWDPLCLLDDSLDLIIEDVRNPDLFIIN